jgi:glucarate dehydratase
MRITGIQLHRVRVPYHAPILWVGGIDTATSRTILRMQTDEGLEGLAETTADDATFAQLHTLMPAFIDQNPMNHGQLVAGLRWVLATQGASGKHAVQALETACWDIAGKATEQPLCQLLGGRQRDEIPAIAYVHYRAQMQDGAGGESTPEQIVDYTRNLVARYGFTTIKMKGGVYEPEHEYQTVLALREAFPGHLIRFDPNALWSVETAIRLGRRLEPLDLEWYEDPVLGIDGMRRVRRELRIPFATNMCSVQLDQLPLAIRSGAIDIQLLDIDDWGGLTHAMKAAAACETFSIGVGLHSSAELGISTALHLHVAAALPSLPHAMDSHYHHESDDIIVGSHTYVRGGFAVPVRPGLGVDLDHEKLQEFEQRFQRGEHEELGDRPEFAPRFPGQW